MFWLIPRYFPYSKWFGSAFSLLSCSKVIENDLINVWFFQMELCFSLRLVEHFCRRISRERVVVDQCLPVLGPDSQWFYGWMFSRTVLSCQFWYGNFVALSESSFIKLGPVQFHDRPFKVPEFPFDHLTELLQSELKKWYASSRFMSIMLIYSGKGLQGDLTFSPQLRYGSIDQLCNIVPLKENSKCAAKFNNFFRELHEKL
jgi:hypothetical protein